MYSRIELSVLSLRNDMFVIVALPKFRVMRIR